MNKMVSDSCSPFQIEYPSYDYIYERVKNEPRVKSMRQYDIYTFEGIDTYEQAEAATKEYFRSWYDEIQEAIEGVCAGNKIYRSLQIKNIDAFIDGLLTTGKTMHEKKMKPTCIGESWAWDRDSAFAYLGDLGKEVKDYIIRGVVEPKNIDLLHTFIVPFTHGKEHEIHLKTNSRISITDIYKKRGGKNLLDKRGIERINVCV